MSIFCTLSNRFVGRAKYDMWAQYDQCQLQIIFCQFVAFDVRQLSYPMSVHCLLQTQRHKMLSYKHKSALNDSPQFWQKWRATAAVHFLKKLKTFVLLCICFIDIKLFYFSARKINIIEKMRQQSHPIYSQITQSACEV